MKQILNTIDNPILSYPLDSFCPPEKALFLDIETTGFTAHSSSLYMIGCAFFQEEKWHAIQWFAQNPSEQAEIIDAFFAFAKDYSFLIHYNGNQFDLPYLIQKCKELGLSYHFDDFEGLDIYRRITPYKNLLSLENCKQKTIERFLGIDREDVYTGGELISIYQDYARNPSDEAETLLLTHNYEDLIGMLSILPILSYGDLFSKPLKAKKVQANHYHDENDLHRIELIITVTLPTSLPVPISIHKNGVYARLEGEEGQIKVPVFEDIFKYFYSNYKDYYYLPEEDLALHKSVAGFVDKEHRVQANARNCYTRKASLYLQQWDVLFRPFFKKDYDDPAIYFELTDELKKDRGAFAAYASHLLKMLIGLS